MAYTLKLRRNRTFNEPMVYKINGTAADLTGKQVVFHLRKDTAKTDYLTLSTSDAAANLNGSRLFWTNQAAGAYELLISDEETQIIPFDKGNFSFSLEYAGIKRPFGEGAVTVTNP